MTVSAGPDDVLLVDSGYVETSGKTLDAIRRITDGGMKFVVNTHWHGDHSCGNADMNGAGAVIVAHEGACCAPRATAFRLRKPRVAASRRSEGSIHWPISTRAGVAIPISAAATSPNGFTNLAEAASRAPVKRFAEDRSRPGDRAALRSLPARHRGAPEASGLTLNCSFHRRTASKGARTAIREGSRIIFFSFAKSRARQWADRNPGPSRSPDCRSR